MEEKKEITGLGKELKEVVDATIDFIASQARGPIKISALEERLAKLEHEHFIIQTKAIAKEDISEELYKRLEKHWVPYEALNGEDKKNLQYGIRKIILSRIIEEVFPEIRHDQFSTPFGDDLIKRLTRQVRKTLRTKSKQIKVA